jgi:putative transposase
LSNSIPDTSLQELITHMTDLEPPTVIEARPEVKPKIIVPTREKRRLSFHNPTKLKERNNFTRDLDGKVHLEPVYQHPYDLSYACLMIPRFNTHYLTGDIAECLRQWMKEICISFAWRLDFITVHPDYFQWILNVPPATPPSGCIRTIRQQTSLKIFEDFPHFKCENLSKDFWAPGYFVLVGNRPHPLDMINDYIQLTRQQQGI